MASTSRTLSYNALLTSAREKYHKNGVPQDSIFNAIPTLEALRSKGSFKVDADGGEVIRINLIKEQNSNGKSYSGYEAANLTPQDEFTVAYDQWRQYSWTTPISGIEIFKNGGAQKIFDLLAQKEAVTYLSATEDINRDLWDVVGLSNATGSTGNGGKNINSIPLIVQKDPTSTQNVHGIDQSAESWFRNRSIDYSTGQTALGFLNKLRNAVNTANRGRGAGAVDLLIFDQVSYEMFEQALDAKVRYMSTDKASPGFEKIVYKNVECIWDVYVPDMVTDGGGPMSAGTNGGPDVTLAEGSVFGLNSKTMKFYCGKGKDFKPTPFVDGFYNGQDAKVSMTMLYAQLVCDARRNNVLLHGLPLTLTS